MEPHQFSQAMQSLNDYGLHIVDAADIAHHLKFENFNDPVPLTISNMFSNPLHYVTIAFATMALIFFVYKIYCVYQKRTRNQLRAMLPAALAAHIPPAYVHNDPHNIPMVTLNLK